MFFNLFSTIVLAYFSLVRFIIDYCEYIAEIFVRIKNRLLVNEVNELLLILSL